MATATIMATTTSSKAADFYWDNGAAEATPLWATLTNWDTLADGTGGILSPFPAHRTSYYFNTSILNAPQVASIATATLPLAGLVFNNTGTTTINPLPRDCHYVRCRWYERRLRGRFGDHRDGDNP